MTWAHSAPSGIKESVCWGPPPTTSPLKSCEYHALCSRFQELLLLPGESPGPQNLPYPRPSSGPWLSPRVGAMPQSLLLTLHRGLFHASAEA